MTLLLVRACFLTQFTLDEIHHMETPVNTDFYFFLHTQTKLLVIVLNEATSASARHMLRQPSDMRVRVVIVYGAKV